MNYYFQCTNCEIKLTIADGKFHFCICDNVFCNLCFIELCKEFDIDDDGELAQCGYCDNDEE